MIKKLFLVIYIICILYVTCAQDIKIGATAHSDGIFTSICIQPTNKIFTSLEFGPSWEWQADMRINDFLIRNIWKWTIIQGKYMDTTVSSSLEYRSINTCSSIIYVPGISAGIGWNLGFGNQSISFDIGFQYILKEYLSTYTSDNLYVYYIQKWQAPIFWVSCSWLFAEM